MRLHRFYVGQDFKLKKDFWLHDEKLLWQWNRVLRFRSGQKVVLFDAQHKERLYKIAELSRKEAHLQAATDMVAKLPKKHIYLFWSLLKRENNEFVIQKCSELGVSNFVPVLSERTIKKDFNLERARKIAVEASEQCGRGSVPVVREPLHLEKAIEEYKDKLKMFVCQEGGQTQITSEKEKVGLLIGPEGGWSDNEQKMFSNYGFKHMSLSTFVLRAETAAIIATSKLL